MLCDEGQHGMSDLPLTISVIVKWYKNMAWEGENNADCLGTVQCILLSYCTKLNAFVYIYSETVEGSTRYMNNNKRLMS
jgi:hypothetical protein